MIKFGLLEWSHAFSYGPDNSIDLSKEALIQLVGKNGHGKSSVALVLEEVLYNKNSKGTKKAKVLNRYSDSKNYSISLSFMKDTDSYKIKTVRGATQSVELFKNGKDISSHTSTGTYKQIEEIIGYDHKTFCQIVYQSNAFSLEFLKATDTTRKKFLIDLLKLNRYTEISELIKADVKAVDNEVKLLTMKLNSVDSWLTKYASADLTLRELVSVPSPATEAAQHLVSLQEKLRTLAATNKRIRDNNKYIELLNSIDLEILPAPTTDIVKLKVSEAECVNKIKALKAVINNTGPILTKCPSCGQAVDNSHKAVMLEEAKQQLPGIESAKKLISEALVQAESELKKYNQSVANTNEWEKYSGLIDRSLPKVLIEQADVEAEIKATESLIKAATLAITNANTHNIAVETHNAKVKVILEQMEATQAEKNDLVKQLELVQARLGTLQILAKTFSTTGFIAYKIESLVKDLEELTNKYLTDMSDGRFQIQFSISSSDKLDVLVTDNGEDVDISDLSNGELARVNISTLLAIRSLMQSLSNVRSNLLILDETIENLDPFGKDKLVEVLLKEDSLNTVLISHSFTHPLITKVEIVKEKRISRILE